MIVISGILLIMDVILDKFNIQFSNTFGFNSSSNFVFFISQWLAIILIIVSNKLNPFNISFFSPIYFLGLNFYWLIFTRDYNSKDLFSFSVFGISVICVALLVLIANKYKIYNDKQKALSKKMEMLENILDLSILKAKKDSKNV